MDQRRSGLRLRGLHVVVLIVVAACLLAAVGLGRWATSSGAARPQAFDLDRYLPVKAQSSPESPSPPYNESRSPRSVPPHPARRPSPAVKSNVTAPPRRTRLPKPLNSNLGISEQWRGEVTRSFVRDFLVQGSVNQTSSSARFDIKSFVDLARNTPKADESGGGVCSSPNPADKPSWKAFATPTPNEKFGGSIDCVPLAYDVYQPGKFVCKASNLVLQRLPTDSYLLAQGCMQVDSSAKGAIFAGADDATKRYLSDENFRPNACDTVNRVCSQAQVKHTVLLWHRYDATNTFHSSEDFATLFTSLGTLQQAIGSLPEELQMIITDNGPSGHFVPTLDRISRPHPVLWANETGKLASACYSSVFILPFAPPSLLTFKGVGQQHTCYMPVFTALVLWLKNLYPDVYAPTAAPYKLRNAELVVHSHEWLAGAKAGSQPVIAKGGGCTKVAFVTWMSRKSTDARQDLTSWQANRRLANELDIIRAAKRAVIEWNSAKNRTVYEDDESQTPQSCSRPVLRFEFVVVDLSLVPFYPYQLKLFASTYILTGVHGAGMGNLIYLDPKYAHVVEFMHGHTSGNHHYHNTAKFAGVSYTSEDPRSSSTIDPTLVAERLRTAMDIVDSKWP